MRRPLSVVFELDSSGVVEPVPYAEATIVQFGVPVSLLWHFPGPTAFGVRCDVLRVGTGRGAMSDEYNRGAGKTSSRRLQLVP